MVYPSQVLGLRVANDQMAWVTVLPNDCFINEERFHQEYDPDHDWFFTNGTPQRQNLIYEQNSEPDKNSTLLPCLRLVESTQVVVIHKTSSGTKSIVTLQLSLSLQDLLSAQRDLCDRVRHVDCTTGATLDYVTHQSFSCYG